MSYYEDPADARCRERDSRRRQVVRSIRGWLREERSPRLTIAALLIMCGFIAITFGWMLARWGVRAWGERAFWSVLLVWPVFLLLIRWRAAVEFEKLPIRNLARQFIATDDLAEQNLMGQSNYAPEPEWRRQSREAFSREIGRAGNPFVVMLFGGLTLGTWLLWLLISYGPTLLAETIVDAELIPAKPQLLYALPHFDWRAEALGFTAIHFVGLAFAAGAVGCAAAYLPGFH